MARSRAYDISHFPQKLDFCIDGMRLAIAEHFRAVTALQNETICRSGQGGDEGGEVAGFRAGDQGGEEGDFGESGGYCVWIKGVRHSKNQKMAKRRRWRWREVGELPTCVGVRRQLL